MKKSLILSFLIGILGWQEASIQAQNPFQGGRGNSSSSITGRITGTVIDSMLNSPIEFATISIYKAGSEKLINGAVSEPDGSFKIPELKLGKYDVSLSFIGYNTKKINNVELTPQKPDYHLGKQLLNNDQIMLDEVEVVGQKAVIENKIDRIVYNAENDASTSGGDATDVLSKVPLLSVDMDGNISLRGTSNIKILVNGKPSGMFSSSVGDALKMIPADQIKNVEVITTPSAKYDAEGTGGIVNIITKKKSIDGVSGSINASVGNRQNNGSLNFNYARGRFGANASGGTFLSWPADGLTSFYREDNLDGISRTLEQNGVTNTSRIGFRGTAGAFYDINAYNSLNTSMSIRGFSFDRDGYNDAVFNDPLSSLIQSYTRSNDGTSSRNGLDWTTDYKKTFKKKDQELSFAFQLSVDNDDSENQIGTTSDIVELVNKQKTFNDGDNFEYTFQVDYVHPFTKKIKLETGAKGILRVINSDYKYWNFDQSLNDFQLDVTRSNLLKYNQDVYSGYGSATINFNAKYSLLAGVRYENTEITGDFLNGEEKFGNSYGNLIPSIILSRKFKNFSTLKVSYVKRIKRPSLRVINPFQDISDNRNITTGNPGLNPELSDQYDIGYTAFIKGSVINSSVYYRRTKDVIERFLQVTEQGISITTYENLGLQQNIGLNLFGSFPITKKWTFRASIDVNSFTVTSQSLDVDLENNGWQYRVFGNTSLNLNKGWKVEGFAFFNSPRFSLQGSFPSFSMMSFGFSKEFWKKKASIGLRVVEPFSKYKEFNTELDGENFVQNSGFQMPFRSFGMSFRYSFGKLNFNQRQRRSKINNDDLKSGGDQNMEGGNMGTNQRGG